VKRFLSVMGAGLILLLTACNRSTTGTIEVNSIPSGADVYINDTLSEHKTNHVFEEMEEGDYDIRLELSGYLPWYGTVTVEPAKTTPVDAILQKVEVGKSRWVNQTGNAISTAPAVADDGTIYVGCSDNSLYAYNPDGSLKWQYDTDGGITSSPAIGSDGTVYFGSHDNYVYAIDASGNLKWKYGTSSNVTSSPAIGADGTIYVGARARRSVTQEMVDYLYAFNPDSTLKWSFEIGEDGDFEVTGSPAVTSDGTIYFGCEDGNLYAIDQNGNEKWTYPTGAAIHSSPAIGSDGTIYFGSNDNNLYAVSSSGNPVWSFDAGGLINGSPTIGSDGNIYVGSNNGKLYAVNPGNGSEVWSYNTSKFIQYSSPAVAENGIIYFGALFGGVYAVNASGQSVWIYETSSSVKSSPAIASDGTIYVGDDGGSFYAIFGDSPLASSAWPRFHHDNRNTGRAQ